MNAKLAKPFICVLVLGGWAAVACALAPGPATGSAVMELKTSPTAAAARRAAATSLWRALHAHPQDLLRTADRLRGLEGEVSSLRSLSARHRSEISATRESLQAAQSQRHTSLALVTLLALLAGATAAFLWHRSRRCAVATPAESWYGRLDPLAEPAVVIDLEHKPAPVAVVPPVAEPLPVVKAPPVPQLTDGPGLKIDALHGAQQQSEFFASLGQIDEAVTVLTSYLEESSERPVLAYLELFRIYHGTGMRVEYEELASTFRQTFGMDVPSFSQYQEDHRELELYLLPVTRIASAWPSVRSQEIIEELVFKRPAAPHDLLSLQAYRELLWLYALGQEVVHHTGLPAGLQLLGDRGLRNDHFILPWADGAPELNYLAVDIDLTAMPSDSHPTSEAVHLPPLDPVPAPAPAPAPAAPAGPDVDAFDAVMEAESRRNFR